MIKKLHRITSEYIEAEDRIRLAGLTEKNETLALWFTMRLASRLVTHCVSLLAKHSPEIKKTGPSDKLSKQNIQSFVQQSAEQQIIEEPSVKVEHNSTSFLVKEIDVKPTSQGLVMIFKDDQTPHYELFLEIQQLRQWLRMLYVIWRKAEWPRNIWPDWMEKSTNESSSKRSIH